jgi:hypothetical protein
LFLLLSQRLQLKELFVRLANSRKSRQVSRYLFWALLVGFLDAFRDSISSSSFSGHEVGHRC